MGESLRLEVPESINPQRSGHDWCWKMPMAPAIRQVVVNPRQVASLRAAGTSWRVIYQQLGIGVDTACQALQSRATTL
jgi:hypothetical protein